LGGHWGKIGLKKQYEDAERALFNTHQLMIRTWRDLMCHGVNC
jgi:hypothetical protein